MPEWGAKQCNKENVVGNYPESSRDIFLDSLSQKYPGRVEGSEEAGISCDPEIIKAVQQETDAYVSADTVCPSVNLWKKATAANVFETPSPVFLASLETAYREVKKAHDLIAALRSLPHRDSYFGGHDHEYDFRVWHEGVLPLLDGNSANYSGVLSNAANRFKKFADMFLDRQDEIHVTCGSAGCLPYLAGWNIRMDQKNGVPDIIQPAILAMVQMMNDLKEFHPEGFVKAKIECEGAGCGEDDFARPESTAGVSVFMRLGR